MTLVTALILCQPVSINQLVRIRPPVRKEQKNLFPATTTLFCGLPTRNPHFTQIFLQDSGLEPATRATTPSLLQILVKHNRDCHYEGLQISKHSGVKSDLLLKGNATAPSARGRFKMPKRDMFLATFPAPTTSITHLSRFDNNFLRFGTIFYILKIQIKKTPRKEHL